MNVLDKRPSREADHIGEGGQERAYLLCMFLSLSYEMRTAYHMRLSV